MATPLRTCVRCQIDVLQATSKRRSSQSIANVRRQYARIPSQWVSRRAYSDNAPNGHETGADPRITLDQITEQLGVPKPRIVTQTQPRYAGEITGLDHETELELTDEEFRRLHPGLGSLTPWSFPLDDSCKTIDALSDNNIGETVKVRGWLYQSKPGNTAIAFATILQGGKFIQVIFDKNAGFENPHKILAVRAHTPVEIEGTLQYKPRKGSKFATNTGEPSVPEDVENFHRTLEIIVSRYEVIGDPPKEPIIAGTAHTGDKRYISMRTSTDLLKALHLRNKVSQICRKHLDEEGFLEVETPLLFKSTPEGAREFLVPTRTPGHMYALPQSPQQYKQILMAGGILKYFQLAKCFRDEDLRADRQPEFTQLDLEMGFVDGTTVQKTIERLLKRIWYEVLGVKLPAFRVMSYNFAISNYGTDKPDTRYGMTIHPFERVVEQHSPLSRTPVYGEWKYEIITHPCNISNSRLGLLASQIASPTDGDLAALRGPNPDCVMFKIGEQLDYPAIRKQLTRIAPHLKGEPLDLERIIGAMASKNLLPTNNIIVIGRRKKEFNPGGSTSIGEVRKQLCQKLIKLGFMEKLVGWKFLWVTHFPLFTPINPSENEPGQSGTAGYKSTHHPFTAPTISTRDSLFTLPWKTLGHHYDVVLNGVELGGGSTRIHDAELQRTILEDILKVPPEKMKTFKHLLDMLETGCPPHAGLAIGFDRLIAILAGRDSIRDVIAFPKNNRGQDLVVGSPGLVTKKQLDEYGIMLQDNLLEGQEEPVLSVEDGAAGNELLVKDSEAGGVKDVEVAAAEASVLPTVEDSTGADTATKTVVPGQLDMLLSEKKEAEEEVKVPAEEEGAKMEDSPPVEDAQSTPEPMVEVSAKAVQEVAEESSEALKPELEKIKAQETEETKVEESVESSTERLEASEVREGAEAKEETPTEKVEAVDEDVEEIKEPSLNEANATESDKKFE
ncbi:aspartyl-tRNA synthetase 2, mitochondrial [Orbilia oligospora]|uniref:Aspartyl-tRNA synthetase 2, mitochondrial n=1 Tax=Orbilia oligospora TaxID=2813651 RepID=A0A8H2DW31_ORBOL|nr:aspartyl-tRNA synthetase 2, mitochondrial [Orbilia oligospora]